MIEHNKQKQPNSRFTFMEDETVMIRPNFIWYYGCFQLYNVLRNNFFGGIVIGGRLYMGRTRFPAKQH